ncbi:MAG: serine hydrolase [Pseudomonadota bacterium]
MRYRYMLLLSLALTATLTLLPNAWANEPDPLEGLWKAYKRFDPYHQGPLLINFTDQSATLSGQRAAVTVEGNRWRVEFPAQFGAFSGRWDGSTPRGHWQQPVTVQTGMPNASPLEFQALSNGLWSAELTPMPSQFTFYLPIEQTEEGALSTFLRNPERNLGVFARLVRIDRDGNNLSFIGQAWGSDEQQVVATGQYYPDFERFTLAISSWRGGTYDFIREPDPANSAFNARPDEPWVYRAPPDIQDGWATGTLADAGIDEAVIRRMIEGPISAPATDVHGIALHGLLIARGGKLVLEEYFNGYHRDLPHDTRSAGKSLGSVLVGAAMHRGVDISPDTSVYAALEQPLDGLDERKRAMTLEHLLTMASGYYCDDGDGDAPGNEDTLQSQQAQPNWYQYILDLPMAMDPGEQAIYCSANSNLIGAVISAQADAPLKDLVQDWIAAPLQIDQYHLNLQPTGELYLGGGSHWLARDYMKLAQMMLNGGTWNGQRIVSEQWARDSVAASVTIDDSPYGWQWWVAEYDWHGEPVTGFFAAGNGGQIFMGIPEADLVIATWGGNYSDSIGRQAQNVLIPDFILPATARR